MKPKILKKYFSKVTVYIKDLQEIYASQKSKIRTSDSLQLNIINIISETNSQVNLHLHCDSIYVNANAGSRVDLSGYALKLKAVSSSGASIDAGQLLSQNGSAKSGPGSKIAIYVIDTLTLGEASGGIVSYDYEPKNIITSDKRYKPKK